MAYLLHTAYQNQGVMPSVLMGLRKEDEPMTRGERAFVLGSTLYALEHAETPVRVRNLVNTEEE